MPKPTKKAVSKPKKRKGKIVVKDSVSVRPKATRKPDTLQVQMPRNNGVSFRVKVRKK